MPKIKFQVTDHLGKTIERESISREYLLVSYRMLQHPETGVTFREYPNSSTSYRFTENGDVALAEHKLRTAHTRRYDHKAEKMLTCKLVSVHVIPTHLGESKGLSAVHKVVGE